MTRLMMSPVMWLMLIGSLLLAAGGPTATAQDAADEPMRRVTLIDSAEREITITGTPKRAATISPAATAMLLAIGVEPVLMAELPPTYAVPDAWADIAEVPVSHTGGPRLEVLAAASPDVILLALEYAAFADRIEQTTAVPVIVVGVERLDDVTENMLVLSAVFGREALGLKTVGELTAAWDAVVEEHGAVETSRVLPIFGGPNSTYAFAPNTYLGDMVQRLGYELVETGGESSPFSAGLLRLGVESAVVADPDAVVVVSHGEGAGGIEAFTDSKAWRSVSAIEAGRVESLSDMLYAVAPGLDSTQALRELALVLGQLTGTAEDAAATDEE